METMLTPELATIILLVISLLLLIIIPVLDGTKKFSKYISLRYTLVAIALIMALGCVLDFSHLTESSRNIVLMGGLVLVGLFVIVRSLEKLKLGGKKIELSVQKGDAKLSTTINGDSSDNSKRPKQEEPKQDDFEPSGSIDIDCISSEVMKCVEDERD